MTLRPVIAAAKIHQDKSAPSERAKQNAKTVFNDQEFAK